MEEFSGVRKGNWHSGRPKQLGCLETCESEGVFPPPKSAPDGIQGLGQMHTF